MISNKPERTLPHRDPFLWVHRLVERSADGNTGAVELDVPENLEVFKGHFPGRPVFPGVLQMEAVAQACLWIHLGELPEGSPLPEVLFVAVDNYKFRRPVVPPDCLVLRGQWAKARAGLQLWDVSVTSKKTGEKVSEGTFWLKMGPTTSTPQSKTESFSQENL